MINSKFLFLFFIIPNLCFAQIIESFDSPLSSEWGIIDEPNALDGPSSWSVSGGELLQTSNIRKFTNRKGTFLYYIPGVTQLELLDVSMQWTQKSDDNDGIGFVFRGTTINDYYRFSSNLQSNFRRLEKNVGGVFTTLAEDNVPYTQSVAQTIRIDAVGDQIQVFVDGNLVFDVTDSSHDRGTFAFYSHANNGVHFDNLVVDILNDSGTGNADTIAPSISITSPNGDGTTMGLTTISADAVDNVGVIAVDFFLDGAQLDTDTTPPFAIPWDTIQEANGVFTLVAKAYDAAGNIGTSSPLQGVIDNPNETNSSLINVQVTPARTSCVAPCSIFFDASGTTSDTTSRPFHELNYSWNFDDINSGNWAWSGKSKNVATSAMSTHVFESAGVHNVTLTVRDEDGNVATEQTTITIEDPDNFYGDSNTYCFSTGSNFSGCPTNLSSQHITTGNIQTVENYVGAGKRLLLRRGDSWSTNDEIILSGSGSPSILGAFGTCTSPDARGICANAPKITITSGSSDGIQMSASAVTSDWRVMDIELSGSAGGKGFYARTETHHLLVLRMNIHDFGTLVFIDDGKRYKSTNVTVADSDLQRAEESPSCLWFNGSKVSVLGNKIKDSTGSEHVIRMAFVKGGVLANNDLSDQAPQKHVLKLHTPKPEYGLTTDNVVISDNKFKGIASRIVSIQPETCGSNRNGRLSNIIFERNLLQSGSTTQTSMTVAAREVTIRNNIFNMKEGHYQKAIDIDRCRDEPAPKNVAVINNSFYSGYDGNVKAVKVGEVDSNITAINNLVYAPYTTNFDMTTGSINTQNNLRMNSNEFVSSSFSNPADFKLKASSAAVDSGINHAAVALDFEQRLRSSIDAIRDIGAFEQ